MTLTEEVAPGIHQIDTEALGNPRLIASYLIQGSERSALIDPGFPSSLPTVLARLEELEFDVKKLDYIIATHTHIDHAGAIGELARLAPGSQVVVHSRGSYYLRNPAKIAGGGKSVFSPEISNRFGEVEGVERSRIIPVSDGDTVDLGKEKLTVFYSPGHSTDHISLYEKESSAVITGDTFCLHYPELADVLIPAGSPPIYQTNLILAELKRLSELDIKTVLTPHFGKASTSDPQKFIQQNITTVENTRNDIKELFSQGLEFHQLVETLRERVLDGSGKSADEIPPFLRDSWLRAMLRVGLMGYMADILEYARNPRPFHGL